AILPGQHLEVGRERKVDERQVTEEAVGKEDVEKVLPVLVGCPVRNDEIYVEIEVTVVEKLALGRRRLTPSVSTSLPRLGPL
ncbi:MAG: hypothetical protein WAO08_11285, partial [Hyphomicrobiaceae bacterium]